MPAAFPCGICLKFLCGICCQNHKAVKFDNCDLLIHIKCKKINVKTYNSLINDNTVWYCLTCPKKLYPFSALNDNDFIQLFKVKQSNLKPSLEKEAP